ncbi:MAG: tetratricopeptide repeat protein [Phycisphaerales bacterium]|nr:MAG: tetratricopeptide repeat protein [Phycisphaerales bacterium]
MMSRLLEIFGRAITVDTAELIWHWLNALPPPADAAESQQDQQLAGVIELMGEMKQEAARRQLTLYLFEKPTCIRGRMAAAAFCLHENQPKEAISELNSVYLRQPGNTMALYALGHCYERLGAESQALEFYQDCLKFKNYLQLPAQRLAAIYLKNAQFEKTIQQYELLKTEYPGDISTLVTLGYLYAATARHPEAVETFNTAILIHPDNFASDDDDVDQLISDGQLHEALERIEDLSQEQPERADLLMKRADVLAMLGATDECIDSYEQALALCPDFLEATIKLGTKHLQAGRDRLAAQYFNAAVEINDNIVEAYIGLAKAQALAGDFSEAVGTLSLAAAIAPNTSMLFAETAMLQFRASLTDSLPPRLPEHDSAKLIETVIEAHRRQASQNPQNPDIHYRLGILLAGIGKLAAAISCFEAALEINPAYHRAATKLAVCLFDTGRPKIALERLTVPDKLDKDTLELHYKTALLYCDKVKFAGSLLNLERHLEENFAAPEAAVNVSVVLQNLGLLDRVTLMWENLSDTAARAAGIMRAYDL